MRRRRTAVGEISLPELTDIYAAYAALSLGGITQLQYLECGSDNMAAHITQRARTVVPPAAPVERYQVIYIFFIGGSTQPEIPVQLGWNRRLLIGPLNALRPYRPVCKAIYFGDVSNGPGTIPVYQLT